MKKAILYKSIQDRNAELQAELDKNNKVLNDIDSGVLFPEEQKKSDSKFPIFDFKVNNYVNQNGKPYMLSAQDICDLETTDCEDIEPMLLTREILDSCETESCIVEDLKCEYLTFLETKDGFCLSDNRGRKLSKVFKYVHQFQNLFYAIYQQELNLNL